jgi:hypothetical protein
MAGLAATTESRNQPGALKNLCETGIMAAGCEALDSRPALR